MFFCRIAAKLSSARLNGFQDQSREFLWRRFRAEASCHLAIAIHQKFGKVPGDVGIPLLICARGF